MTRRPIARVPLVLMGPGRVGRALLGQLIDTREPLQARTGLRLCVIAVADGSGLVVASKDEIDDAALAAVIDYKSRGRALADYRPDETGHGVAVVDGLDPAAPHAFDMPPILVDASAADTSASLLDARRAGWRLALANKIPLTGPYDLFEELTDGGRGARWETTVASSLPVVALLQRLCDQGDDIRWITGALSGTLGYLTKCLSAGERLSSAVERAVRDGLTEPDPRTDLSGLDVARKALILARMVGLPIELTDVRTESLYPSTWNAMGTASFLRRLATRDDALTSRWVEAEAQGAALRYAATIGDGGARTGWVTLDEAAPLARVDPTDSAVAFETNRYREHPLLVSGRGGGPDTTAAGLMADVVDLARR